MLRLWFPTQESISLTECRWLRLIVTALALVTIVRAQATETVLYDFPTLGANGGLISDQEGNLYGTTSGLSFDFGTVFELQHFPDGTWGNKLLYQFTGTTDGAYPHSRLIFDSAGNLYGTTAAGGTNFCLYIDTALSCGIVFELMPTPTGEWTEKVLYNFAGFTAGGMDGANPSAGVIFDSAGDLFGTTAFGGLFHGTVFELVPNSDGTWTEKVLYSFNGGADGNGPAGGLVLDGAGNLYGTTDVGGNNGNGTIFELSPGPGDTWTFHLLYAFCSQVGCSDGGRPSGVILDSRDNLYGTTSLGGIVPCSRVVGCGTAYKLSREVNGVRTFDVLHSFCSLATCADGAVPSSSLIFDNSGNLYGTTIGGGTSNIGGGSANAGTVFELSHRANRHHATGATVHVPGGPWIFDSLYSFCALPQCLDGLNPLGSLLLDGAGNLYGTTEGGGTVGAQGVIFKITR